MDATEQFVQEAAQQIRDFLEEKNIDPESLEAVSMTYTLRQPIEHIIVSINLVEEDNT